MTLRHRTVLPADHLWLRVCRPDWEDPFDPGFAARRGGRWTPPGTWPTLYLSRDVATARLQVDRLLEGTSVAPDDLTDDAFELVGARLPRRQDAADVVTSQGVAAAGLPAAYPDDGHGGRVAHETCWPVAVEAHDSGLDGVECRSAASVRETGRELAWWPRGRRPRPRATRVPYGGWRSADVTDARALLADGGPPAPGRPMWARRVEPAQPAAAGLGSFGSPRTRSPTMLRWISAVPPQMVSEREKKNEACMSLTG